MDHDRYLELIAQDGTKLSTTARRLDLDLPIPTCPGWTVRECVRHTGGAYQHKISCMRLGRRPGDDEFEEGPATGVDVIDWFDTSLATLLAELRDRGPSAPSYTWWPADQTTGFWYRRMAQETAVHRIDVEDAGAAATPIDEDLAVDGIDEVLDRFLSDDWDSVTPDEWDGVDPNAGAGSTIAVRTRGTAWRSTLGPDVILLERGDGDADAAVAGEPEAVLLWLWGRRPDSTVELEGDPAALAAFRDRLRIATQ
jgi:uncharacterized protein (TIGR03083 family)